MKIYDGSHENIHKFHSRYSLRATEQEQGNIYIAEGVLAWHVYGHILM